MNAKHTLEAHFTTPEGLNMYYEIHGTGYPLVLLHGGGSTINSTFGNIIPGLAKTHQVIAIELQAHGRTADIDRPLTFEQDADDVAALLRHLKISSANIMGFSNGGTTSLQLAIRHPELVNKLILASTTYKLDGMQPGFFDGFEHATLAHMPQQLRDACLAVNPDPRGLQRMFERDVARMVAFKNISDDAVRAILAPALVINGDAELVRAEHALELAHTLQHAQLAILPGGHGDYIGEVCAVNKYSKIPALVVELIEEFLKK